MSTQLAILQVVVPLLAAPLCLVISRTTLVWFFALVASIISFFISLSLLIQVMQSGTIIYSLGGWQAPVGIEYRIDHLSAYLLLIVSAISSVILLAAKTSIGTELPNRKHSLFYVVYLLCLAGMLGIVATGDIMERIIILMECRLIMTR